MATKSFQIGPQDGWTLVVTGAAVAIDQLRISGVPHSHVFQVYGGADVPTPATPGMSICHKPLHLNVADNADAFYVRVINNLSGSKNNDGRMRIDVYSQGGVLS